MLNPRLWDGNHHNKLRNVHVFRRRVRPSARARFIQRSSRSWYVFPSLPVLTADVTSGNWRKRLLLSFGFVGATARMLFLVVVPKVYLLGSFLVIVGVTWLGSSFVVLNSFLPLLATNHPPAQEVTSGNKQDPPHISMETLSSGHTNSESVDQDDHSVFTSFESNTASKTGSHELQLSTRISSKGIGIGYLAAVFVQCLSILLLFSLKRRSLTLRRKHCPFVWSYSWSAYGGSRSPYLLHYGSETGLDRH
jgi:Vacuole effluxer Atg22 like